MRVIPVDVYPIGREYDTFEAAIAGANGNPLQPKARADSARLAGTTVVDACWTDTDFVIRFSNGQFLHIYVRSGAMHCGSVEWQVRETPPVMDEKEIQRVGAEPVIHRWRPSVGDYVQDCSALAAKRRGAPFQQLFVNELGLLVYCRGQMIWWFGAVRRTDLDQPVLSVSEDT